VIAKEQNMIEYMVRFCIIIIGTGGNVLDIDNCEGVREDLLYDDNSDSESLDASTLYFIANRK